MIVSLGPDIVVGEEEIVAILDWNSAKARPENREMVGYARAHGFLWEREKSPQALVVTRSKLYLVSATAATLRRRLQAEHSFASEQGVLR